MIDLRRLLESRLFTAFAALDPDADPVLRPSDRADFQANGALALAKRLGRKPRELAEEVCSHLDLEGICSLVEVSGPGFINLFLEPQFLAAELARAATEGLGVPPEGSPLRVVVDYSHPNVAKEMHVGHLRTTIIGDALCRILTYCGHEVIRENHIGDWGTPFGMLIEHLLDIGESEAAQELSVGDLTSFYRQARVSFDADEEFKARSRRRVVLLQSGDEETLRLWRVLVAESVGYFNEVYRKLGVTLTDSDIVGESFYNADLPALVEELRQKGLLVESDGALCVFPPGFVARDEAPLPLIVQKSDGGFGYAATDLAAIRDRVGRLKADLILYVVGAPQEQHLAMCFAVAKMAGWLDDGVIADHVAFGSVLGTDHKMLKTRAGESIKLGSLLDEAILRAQAALAERSSDLGEQERAAVARAIGIGAVKYADLSTERTRDYVFDWDRMLAFEGNTGPYLQYAHARICSIFRRSGAARPAAREARLDTPQERELAVALLGLPEAIRATVRDRSPNRLCAYLFEAATIFTTFYEQCPVLRAESEERREDRLLLCSLTAAVLATGLGLLGIEAPERM